ncbi:hypothetical protein M501DRAFT_1054204 [Patellaria atrata CBS 101060]|uniref:Uncharacterized protein n=1 Tax=Patellaria atrata CBS 101060 TaxID=1346257 RepID=A0A9P4SIT1_9PEZI|nr:hypothetical protein M501DRAFT_1054204 [Patellaria atrata CBS 101060]
MKKSHQPKPLSTVSANIVKTTYSVSTTANVDALNAFHAMDERDYEDFTQSDAGISDVTSLENGTGDFGKRIYWAAREAQRAHNAQQSGARIQAFKKARTHPRVGLTLENLERNNKQSPSAGLDFSEQFRRPGSVSSDEQSEPPVHAPREWGRKARQNLDWLRRLNVREDSQEPAQKDEEPDPTYPQTRADSARDIDWAAAAADVPLPSIEESSGRALPARIIPASIEKRNTSLDRIQEWEAGEDFTLGSVIASTPAVPRSRMLDDIRQREIEEVKERAVTTSRLDKFREKTPEFTLRPRSASSRSLSSQQIVSTGDVTKDSERSSHPEQSQGRERAYSSQGALESPRKSPIMVYKSSETVGSINQGIQAKAQASPRRPNHTREDSHDILKRLARATSSTPSPRRSVEHSSSSASSKIPVKQNISKEVKTKQTSLPQKDLPQQSNSRVNRPISHTSKSEPILDLTSEPQSQTVAQDENKRVSSPSKELRPTAKDSEIDTAQNIEEPTIIAKTPVVTGAWIDTPAPKSTKQARPKALEIFGPSFSQTRIPVSLDTSPEKSPVEEEPAEPTPRARPKMPEQPPPPSALGAILNSVRRRKGKASNEDGDTYGDSTINSLEDLMVPSDGDIPRIDPEDDTLQGLQVSDETPKNAAERQRQQEIRELHNMNNRLKAARISVRDASRGMRSLEHRVDSQRANEIAAGAGCEVCKTCGHAPNATIVHHTTVIYVFPWSGMWDWVKNRFRYRDERGRFKFTWLGLFSVLFIIWYFTEQTLCSVYCNKQYASHMVGFGVDPNAPVKPYVTFTLAMRPFEPMWRPVLKFLDWVFPNAWKLFEEPWHRRHRLLHESYRSFPPPPPQSTTRRPYSNYGRMDDDEILM